MSLMRKAAMKSLMRKAAMKSLMRKAAMKDGFDPRPHARGDEASERLAA